MNDPINVSPVSTVAVVQSGILEATRASLQRIADSMFEVDRQESTLQDLVYKVGAQTVEYVQLFHRERLSIDSKADFKRSFEDALTMAREFLKTHDQRVRDYGLSEHVKNWCLCWLMPDCGAFPRYINQLLAPMVALGFDEKERACIGTWTFHRKVDWSKCADELVGRIKVKLLRSREDVIKAIGVYEDAAEAARKQPAAATQPATLGTDAAGTESPVPRPEHETAAPAGLDQKELRKLRDRISKDAQQLDPGTLADVITALLVQEDASANATIAVRAMERTDALQLAARLMGDPKALATIRQALQTIPVAETPVAETPVAETPVAETPVAETPVAETPVAETPVAPVMTGTVQPAATATVPQTQRGNRNRDNRQPR